MFFWTCLDVFWQIISYSLFSCLDMFGHGFDRTVYTLHSTKYTVQITLYTVQITQYRLHSTKYTLQSTHYRLLSTDYTVQCIHYTVQSTDYTVHSTQYRLLSTKYTLHSTKYGHFSRQGFQELSNKGLTRAVFCVAKAQDAIDAAKQRLSALYKIIFLGVKVQQFQKTFKKLLNPIIAHGVLDDSFSL